jgi:hypothetical protein
MTLNTIQKAALASLCALAYAGTSAAGGAKEPVEIDADDRVRAAAQLGSTKKLALSALKPFHIDGTKGYSVHAIIEGPSLKQPELMRKRIALSACRANVFGLVELESARSFVGKDDAGVFTKYRFRVLDDWRAAPTDQGKKVDLILEGGEITHGGEVYRAENAFAKYEVGSKYVLLAHNADKHLGKKAILDTPPALEVVDDIVHPGLGWTPFAPGLTLEQAKNVVKEAVAKEGCE